VVPEVVGGGGGSGGGRRGRVVLVDYIYGGCARALRGAVIDSLHHVPEHMTNKSGLNYKL